MNWTKKRLHKQIIECELGIKMEQDILSALKEFEHYSQVNKRFTDRLKELGCHAYIQKDTYSTNLYISKSENHNQYRSEFRHYVSHVMSRAALTWEGIRQDLERYNFSQRLLEAKERLSVIEQETKDAQDLLTFLKGKKFKCFDFYRGIHEIEDALREAIKEAN